MKPLVSVIMPVYNSGKFLDEAVSSVLAQTYQAWELLIVDDCSTDSSYSIMESYAKKDERIHCFQTEHPSGSPTLPRNIAIKNAKGRFIAFLDSDDVWLPNKLAEQIPLFDNSNVAVVYSNYEKISESGEKSNRIVNAPKSVNYSKLLKGNVIGNLTGVYDTDKVGKIFLQPIHHEDYILWLQALKSDFIGVNTLTTTGLYRLRKTSVSANKLKAILWQWNILRNVEKLSYIRAAYSFFCCILTSTRKAFI